MGLRAAAFIAVAASAAAQTLMDLVLAQKDLTYFALAATQSRFIPTLRTASALTVFAPNNAAIMNSTKNEIDYIYNVRNNLTLLNIVQYHSVNGLYPSTSLTDGLILTALDGFDHLVHVTGADIMIDTATLYVKDLKATNGFLHKIDTLLLPPNFALPPVDIFHTIQDNGTLLSVSTTLAAIAFGQMNGTLSAGRGPWTFLAPTDAAWAALPAATRSAIFADPGVMMSVLYLHLLDHRLYAMEMKPGRSDMTVEGLPLVFGLQDEVTTVNGTMVAETDIDCFNGVLFTITGVLLPPNLQ